MQFCQALQLFWLASSLWQRLNPCPARIWEWNSETLWLTYSLINQLLSTNPDIYYFIISNINVITQIIQQQQSIMWDNIKSELYVIMGDNSNIQQMLSYPQIRVPRQHYEETRSLRQLGVIDSIVTKHHSHHLIHLEDQITFHQEEENLKRLYGSQQYHNKISALSEYYKFHFEAPRLFMKYISDTVENYVCDKRDLEFNKVTQLIQNKKPATKTLVVKKNHKRLLGNISVSYLDFENKHIDDGKAECQKRKVTFKHTKASSTATHQHTGGLTRQKSNLAVGIEARKLTKQPSLNTLVRTKSKKEIRSDLVGPIKVPAVPLEQIQAQTNIIGEPAIIQELKRQKSKVTLSKAKSSVTLKNFSLKNLQSNKNSYRVSKNQSHTDSNKDGIGNKPLTSRKVSIQGCVSRRQKQNYQPPNKYRSSIQNILFKKGKT